MRTISILSALAAVFLFGTGTAQATEGPWCANYKYGHRDCSQPSFSMCLFDVRGMGGTCSPNPRYRTTPPLQPRPRAKKRAAG